MWDWSISCITGPANYSCMLHGSAHHCWCCWWRTCVGIRMSPALWWRPHLYGRCWSLGWLRSSSGMRVCISGLGRCGTCSGCWWRLCCQFVEDCCHFGLLFAGSRLRLLHFDISLLCLRQLVGHCCWRWPRVDWGYILIAENSNSFGNHACHFLLRFVLPLAIHLDQLCSWAKDDTVALETIFCPLVWSPASALSNSGPPTRYQPEIRCSFWVNIDTSPPSSTLWMGQCLAALHTTRYPKTKHLRRILGTYYCRTSLEQDMQGSHTTLESIHS